MTNSVLCTELILAPLKGFTDSAFRNAFSAHFGGFDSAVAPFVTACPPERFEEAMLRDLAPGENRRLPVEPQILGASAEEFLFLHRQLADLGYRDVNWNLGCPFRPVMRKGRGAALLSQPERIERFLDRVMPQLSGRLSIKMRLGRNRPEEAFELVPILNRYPLRAVILHPRTARQMYAGPTDLAAFARFRELCRHPVVYNGEIRREEDALFLRDRLGAIPAWMIGRGALQDPFLPARLKGRPIPAARERLERFWAFHDELTARYAACLGGDPLRLLNRMKGFWTYFSRLFAEADEIRRRVHHAARLEEWCRLLEELRTRGMQGDGDGAPHGADAPS
ncbi:MAG: tRNA-dihydrouridine synthase family protein [Desulfobacterales bacterium]